MSLPVLLPLTSSFGDAPNTLRARLTAAAATDLPHGAVRRVQHGLQASFDDFVALESTCASHRSLSSRHSNWETLHGGQGWMAVVTSSDGAVEVAVQATASTLAGEVVERLVGVMRPVDRVQGSDDVAFEFCHAGGRGVRRVPRRIEAPSWAQVSGNYAESARVLLGGLCSVRPPQAGRLVLMWGAPGTGKTTAVRALAREWAPWCRASYVLDPEALFGSSEYFHELALGGADYGLIGGGYLDDDDDLVDDLVDDMGDVAAGVAGDDPEGTEAPARKWRLLVVEDADELIAADAKQRTGQGLSRLLNLTDGIVGQGTRTIVLVTTNEPVSALHPALSRPGRCLARVEVPALSRAEAVAWLEARGVSAMAAAISGSHVTLAELYELVGGSMPLSSAFQSQQSAGYL